MRKSVLICLGILVILSAISPAVAFDGPEPEAWYTFQLGSYVDVIHLNTNPGKWLNGYDEAPGFYVAPVLGSMGSGMAFVAIDFPVDVYWDMAFLAINIAKRDAWMMRIKEDLELGPPEYLQLNPVDGASMEGPTLGEASKAEVTPQAVYNFKVNPYADEVMLDTGFFPWLWGQATVPGGSPCYPAPVLGYAHAGKFYFAMDYTDGDPGCYELGFFAGTVASRDGHFITTHDGMTWFGPTYFWLTPI